MWGFFFIFIVLVFAVVYVYKYVSVFASGFPSQAVVDAYLHPQVDDSKEKFTWSTPDLNMLREYPYSYMPWFYHTLTDKSYLPVYFVVSSKTASDSFYLSSYRCHPFFFLGCLSYVACCPFWIHLQFLLLLQTL